MKNLANVAKLFDQIKTSFWFLPAVMVFAALLASFALWMLDSSNWLAGTSWSYLLEYYDQNIARSLVNTIAGSMITVTSIAFSITIVTLTLASSQFGPRLIRNFMDDRGTQVVLGAFIAQFVYCVVFVFTMSLRSSAAPPMFFSVVWCFAVTLICVFVLIYFIHHVAQSIQADNVIDNVFCELQKSLESLVASEEQITEAPDEEAIERDFPYKQVIYAEGSGYLQLVNRTGLINLAQQQDVLIEFDLRPGELLSEHLPIATVRSKQGQTTDFQQQLIDYYLIGSTRTPLQDPEYAIHQLVEIAVRALSPGINDPYTANTCVDKLSLILCTLANKTLHDGNGFDQDQQLRLRGKVHHFEGVGRACFDQIRQYAVESVSVTIRLLESLRRLSAITSKTEVLDFVEDQLRAMVELQEQHPFCETDQHDFATMEQRIRENLDSMRMVQEDTRGWNH